MQLLINHEKIKSLTGIRFIAAYIVVLSHLFGEFSQILKEMGGISVQLFFCLIWFCYVS